MIRDVIGNIYILVFTSNKKIDECVYQRRVKKDKQIYINVHLASPKLPKPSSPKVLNIKKERQGRNLLLKFQRSPP